MSERDTQPDLLEVIGEAERFDPTRDGPDLAYEHVHRYMLAQRAVARLEVLDLGSGSGFGSKLLEQTAKRVTSLDLSAQAARLPTRGVCGDALSLPFASGSFDAVVCFEAIEHVPDPAALVAEVRRVLRDPALFLVSTPDREIYTDRAGHDNEFHIAEMTRDEFRSILRRRFSSCRILGQGLWAGSWISRNTRVRNSEDLGERKVSALRFDSSGSPEGRTTATWSDPEHDELPMPVYLIALCADSVAGRDRLADRVPNDSVLHDPEQWLIGQYEKLCVEWGDELATFQSQLLRARKEFEDQAAQIEGARVAIAQYEDESDRVRHHVDALELELDAMRTQVAAAGVEEGRLEEARLAIEGQKAEIDNARRVNQDREAEIASARLVFEEQNQAIEQAAHLERELSADLEGLRTLSVTQLEELQAAAVAAEDQAAQIEAAKEAIESKTAEIKDARESITGFEEQLTAAGGTISLLRAELEGSVSRLEDEVAVGVVRVADLDEKLTAQTDESARLDQLLQDREVVQEETQSKVVRLDKEIDELRVALTRTEAQRRDRDDRLRAVEIELDGTIYAFGEMTRSFEKTIDGFHEQLRGQKRLERQIEKARGATKRTNAELAEAKQTIERKELDLRTAEDAIAQKEIDLAEARGVIAEKEEDLSESRLAIAKKESELSEASSAARSMDGQLASARDSISEMTTELRDAESVIVKQGTEILEASEEIRVRVEAAEEAQREADVIRAKRMVRWALRLTSIKNKILGRDS